MTTRRTVLGGLVAVAALAGCQQRKPAGPAAVPNLPVPDRPVPDVLVAGSRTGLVRLDGTGAHPLGPAAEISRDGRVAYTVRAGVAGGSSLVRLDVAGGEPVRSTTLGGGWVPREISADGRACVLARSAATDRPAARPRTSLLVVTDDGQRTYDLAGVVEPDAFTRDGTGLFVLEWLPATAPDHYRVRVLDLTRGALSPLSTRAKVPVPAGAEEEMRGLGRQAVLSPDATVLYTLYTHQPGHQHTRDLLAGTRGNVHAFVHVLQLTERWAYCLDLPHPFGEGPAESHALAADDEHVAVVDRASGSLVYAGTGSLAIEKVIAVPAAAGTASLQFTGDRRVLLGAGPAVTVLDRGGAAVTGTWPVPGVVGGLALSPDGRRLYVGGTDEVVWLDAASGAVQGRAAVPGLTAVRHVG